MSRSAKLATLAPSHGLATSRDIAEVITGGGFTVDRRQIVLDRPIKTLGVHATNFSLHPQVRAPLTSPHGGRSATAGPRRRDATVIREEASTPETFNPDAIFEEGGALAQRDESSEEGLSPKESLKKQSVRQGAPVDYNLHARGLVLHRPPSGKIPVIYRFELTSNHALT